MGSEFIKRGIHLPAHTWSANLNLEAQEIVYNLHKEYVNMGCDYITTNTFRATPRSFMKTGLSNLIAHQFAKASLVNATTMANKASDGTAKILASLAPLEDCYKPELFPGKDIAYEEYKQLSEWFINGPSFDVFLLETMNSIDETQACLKALSHYNKPIWVSFVLKDSKHLLSGESLNQSIDMLGDFPVNCMLLNCNAIKRTNDAMGNIATLWDKKWGIYPNFGIGEPSSDGNIKQLDSNENLINLIDNAIKLGATYIGGCCGSNPYHTQLIKNNINKLSNA